MPQGSAPGERRGGRQRGTPNKATAEKKADLHAALALAFARLGPEEIDKLSPAQMLRLAAHEAAKAGFVQAALSIAKDAAPYFDARPSPTDGAGDSSQEVIEIIGGLPEPEQAPDADRG